MFFGEGGIIFPTLNLDQGIDLRYIKEWLRHSSSKTTEKYTHVLENSIKNFKTQLMISIYKTQKESKKVYIATDISGKYALLKDNYMLNINNRVYIALRYALFGVSKSRLYF